MARVVQKQKRNRKRKYAVILTVILLAAAGAGLYRLPPSLLDIDRIIRLAADKFLTHSADIQSAEPVLRGTVFDRNLNELAVSYQLFSVYARPSEITDHRQAARDLGRLTGAQETALETRLKEGSSLIKVAKNVDEKQAAEINDLQLSGVYCRPVEERFYPEHETAAELIGYTEEGTGLQGIEGEFDTVLQHGEFRSGSLPEIDFEGTDVLGSTKLDLVLTLDLEIQQAVEEQLRGYLKTSGATRGVVIVLNPRTGAVIAWVGQPSFNPNYFWQEPAVLRAGMFTEAIDSRLYRRLMVKGAAVYRDGEQAQDPLPVPIAAPEYNLLKQEITQYEQLIGLHEDMQCRFPVCRNMDNGSDKSGYREDGKDNGVSALQLITAVAGMMNGGVRISPFVLESVLDGAQKKFYSRSREFDEQGRRRIFSPSMGIMLRRSLGQENQASGDDFFLYTDSVARVVRQGEKSRYVMQDMLIGAMPAKYPEMLTLMVTQQDFLNPLPKGKKRGSAKLTTLGRKLLPSVYTLAGKQVKKEFPEGRDASNYNRFLISRRIDYQSGSLVAENKGPVMPPLTGLSLRKGLRRLNSYNLKVRVEGSGRIVAQQPEPGEPLYGVGECVLVLESEI
jgi:cell division protein FtsI (penicillin-binding protein 3)